MYGLNALSRAKGISLVAAVMYCTASPASAKTPEPPGLFGTAPASAKLVLPKEAIAGKSKAVQINRAQLRNGRLFIKLPGDISFEAQRDRREDFGNGRAAWVGKAGDDPQSAAVFGM